MVDRAALLNAIAARRQPGASPVSQFNPYAAGAKTYGGGRSAPNVGKTANKTGYAMRDAKRRAITGRA